jgi:hypothetical protein
VERSPHPLPNLRMLVEVDPIELLHLGRSRVQPSGHGGITFRPRDTRSNVRKAVTFANLALPDDAGSIAMRSSSLRAAPLAPLSWSAISGGLPKAGGFFGDAFYTLRSPAVWEGGHTAARPSPLPPLGE